MRWEVAGTEAGLQRGSIEGQVPAGILYTICRYPVPFKRNFPERVVQLDDNVLVVNISRLDTKRIGQDDSVDAGLQGFLVLQLRQVNVLRRGLVVRNDNLPARVDEHAINGTGIGKGNISCLPR